MPRPRRLRAARATSQPQPSTGSDGHAVGTVVVLATGVASISLLLTVLAAQTGRLTVRLPGVTFWVLVAAFTLAESLPIHFELRRETISFSLSLIPLAVGLYASNPWALVAARLIGTTAVLAGRRRQAPLKLSVNLSVVWLETAVAINVFRHVVPGGAGAGPTTWPGLFAATAAGSIAFAAALTAAIKVRRAEARGEDGAVPTRAISALSTAPTESSRAA